MFKPQDKDALPVALVPGFRWTVVVLLFFATTINYLDRQVIGLLKPTLAQDFNWSEVDYSRIVMAFSAAYALGLLFFGRLIDLLGTKIGYALSVSFWSLAAMLHALAGSTLGFGVMRALLGLGESGNFPAAIKAVAEWFPKKERALATGIFNSGANVGAVVAPLLVPLILVWYGWQAAFLITGATGFLWLGFWWYYYEAPQKQARLTETERNYINHDQEKDADTSQIAWGRLFKVRQTWAFVLGKFLTDPIWWFFLFWLPDYFSAIFELDLKKPSWALAIVYTATTLGSVGGGYLSGYFIQKGWTDFKARKTAMLIFAFCVVPIVAIQFATQLWQAVLLISLAAAAHQAWSANIFTTASDMFPKQAVSSVVGIGGMAGSIGGILFPLLVGYLLDYYKNLGQLELGYNLLFVICGFAYLLAWGLMHLFAPRLERVRL